MKTDIYTKTILTAIAVLLGALTFKPALRPESVQAAQATNRAIAPTGQTPYRYTYYMGDGIRGKKDDDFIRLNELATNGWELVDAVPMQNQRNDNLAMGTAEILYIFRQRK